MSVREFLSFGFEATFTIENWWEDSGFCSEWETPTKSKRMAALAEGLRKRFSLEIIEISDVYGAKGFKLTREGEMIFQITPEPGSIEVNTPPAYYHEIPEIIGPLLDCAAVAGLVTYRSWWYGIKTGTGGGCHLNMAGKVKSENLWFLEPKMALYYYTFFYNHPSLHYPFMGPDIGYGGNCMRLDEQGEASAENLSQFRELLEIALAPNSKLKTLDDYYDFLKGAPLREVKHSAPTFRKLRNPDYLVEDRAVEMPRTVEEFSLLCDLRVRLLDWLRAEGAGEDQKKLRNFGSELHGENLGYAPLFSEFQKICKNLTGLRAEDYRVFFERQFPRLRAGVNVPNSFFLREGKRPRKVVGVHEAAGNLVLSKKIDTSFKRLELHSELHTEPHTESEIAFFRVNGQLLENTPNGVLLDLKVPSVAQDLRPLVRIEALSRDLETVEEAVFGLSSFMFEAGDFLGVTPV